MYTHTHTHKERYSKKHSDPIYMNIEDTHTTASQHIESRQAQQPPPPSSITDTCVTNCKEGKGPLTHFFILSIFNLYIFWILDVRCVCVSSSLTCTRVCGGVCLILTSPSSPLHTPPPLHIHIHTHPHMHGPHFFELLPLPSLVCDLFLCRTQLIN
jgi:hypothetical protein